MYGEPMLTYAELPADLLQNVIWDYPIAGLWSSVAVSDEGNPGPLSALE